MVQELFPSTLFSRWWFQIFFYVHPYLGKWSNLTTLTPIFQTGWNHRPVYFVVFESHTLPTGLSFSGYLVDDNDSNDTIMIMIYKPLLAPAITVHGWNPAIWQEHIGILRIPKHPFRLTYTASFGIQPSCWNQVIKNLTGHLIGPYKIHAGKSEVSVFWFALIS